MGQYQETSSNDCLSQPSTGLAGLIHQIFLMDFSALDDWSGRAKACSWRLHAVVLQCCFMFRYERMDRL